MEHEPGHPEAVTHLNALARSDLELPLCRHDLGVGSGNVDAGVQARPVVGLDDVSAVDLVGSNAAIVGSLGPGEAVFGPAEGMLVLVEQGVLLLDAEPWLVSCSPIS